MPRLVHKIFPLKTKLVEHSDERVHVDLLVLLDDQPILRQHTGIDHLLEQRLGVGHHDLAFLAQVGNAIDRFGALQHVALLQHLEVERPFEAIGKEMHPGFAVQRRQVVL